MLRKYVVATWKSVKKKIGKEEDIVFVIILRIKRCNIKSLFCVDRYSFCKLWRYQLPLLHVYVCTRARRIRSKRRKYVSQLATWFDIKSTEESLHDKGRITSGLIGYWEHMLLGK